MKYALANKNYPQAALAAQGIVDAMYAALDADSEQWHKYRNGIQIMLGIEEEFGERGVFKFITTDESPQKSH